MKIVEWQIVCDIEKNVITHILSERIKVLYDIEKRQMIVTKDGEVINEIIIYNMNIYYKKLISYYRDAQLLKQFK